jgi:hypothetical protein
MEIVALEGTYAICRLEPSAALPDWLGTGPFLSITRTADELSLVCSQEAVPAGVRCERDWRCLRLAGTWDLSLVGVLAALLGPLAQAGVSVFVVSSFDTDYLLVKEHNFERAIEVLRQVGV